MPNAAVQRLLSINFKMNMKKSILFIAFTAIMYGCSHNRTTTEHKLIAPLPAEIAVDNLNDCTVPATFTPDNFNWMGGNLTMTVYNQDLYDAVEISQMQVGDTIIYDGKKLVINKIAEEHGGIVRKVCCGFAEGLRFSDSPSASVAG